MQIQLQEIGTKPVEEVGGCRVVEKFSVLGQYLIERMIMFPVLR